MFTRLLVGIDGSPASDIALATAIALARRFQATIVLATVTDDSARGDKLLDAAGKKVREAALASETVQAHGPVTDMLLGLGEDSEVLVIGRRGEQHATGQIGEETSRIIRRSPRPVLVAGHAVSLCRKPVVAYDGGETSSSALTLAARYAEAAKVPIEVVHATEDREEGDQVLARAGAYLSGLPVEFTSRLLEGKPETAVRERVEQGGFDLLLVGAHSGRRRRTWSIGSHAEKLVRVTTVPVIVVR